MDKDKYEIIPIKLKADTPLPPQPRQMPGGTIITPVVNSAGQEIGCWWRTLQGEWAAHHKATRTSCYDRQDFTDCINWIKEKEGFFNE